MGLGGRVPYTATVALFNMVQRGRLPTTRHFASSPPRSTATSSAMTASKSENGERAYAAGVALVNMVQRARLHHDAPVRRM